MAGSDGFTRTVDYINPPFEIKANEDLVPVMKSDMAGWRHLSDKRRAGGVEAGGGAIAGSDRGKPLRMAAAGDVGLDSGIDGDLDRRQLRGHATHRKAALFHPDMADDAVGIRSSRL
ncbi:MAG: hypothetical protein NTW21_06790 [Verrucomicrobia bacterium]|nr:hypothetical protein [Verrucomicrobiota bacterium]